MCEDGILFDPMAERPDFRQMVTMSDLTDVRMADNNILHVPALDTPRVEVTIQENAISHLNVQDMKSLECSLGDCLCGNVEDSSQFPLPPSFLWCPPPASPLFPSPPLAAPVSPKLYLDFSHKAVPVQQQICCNTPKHI